jgi:hypothetical protein
VYSYCEVRVNGLLVRTEEYDQTLSTRDSVVAMRYEDDEGEKIAYGFVQRIIKSRSVTLVGCRWLQDLDEGKSEEELMLGLKWHRLEYNPRHEFNDMMWTPLHCIVLDEHIVWPLNEQETKFALAVKQ